LQEAGLTPEEQSKILGGNIARLLDWEPSE